MNPQVEVFKLALKQYPLSIALVMAGLKPATHCAVQVPEQLAQQINHRYKYNLLKSFPGCGYYCYPRYFNTKTPEQLVTNQVLLIVFNDQALNRQLALFQDHQSSFNFNSGVEVRKAIVHFHKMVYRPHRYSPLYCQDLTVICGLGFGFPLQSTLKFGLEVLTGKMQPQRFGFSVKSEPNLVFIGYPDTQLECHHTIKKWTNFKRTNLFKQIVQQLKAEI